MILTLDIFRAAITVLKDNSLKEVFASLDSVKKHQAALEMQLAEQTHKLSKVLIYYKKYENQMGWRKNSINEKQLMTWIPVLRNHQEASAFSDVKKATVQKIVDAKKEIDRIDLSLSELKLRLQENARNVRLLQDEIKTAATQVLILQSAVDISVFLTSSRYDPKEIAEYEIQKYYDLYRRAGNGIG